MLPSLCPVRAVLVFFFLVAPRLGNASSASTPVTHETASPTTAYQAISTCPNRTINYITETLPQQCLRTRWSHDASPSPSSSLTSDVSADPLATGSPGDLQARLNLTPSTADDNTSAGGIGIVASTASSTNTNAETGPASVSPSSASAEKEQTQQRQKYPASSRESSASANEALSSSAEVEVEADPLLEHGSFLSFEEWKAQMLEKAGQSPEHVGKVGSKQDQRPASARRQRPGELSNALDTLGDDAEIELDFSGFVGSSGGTASDALPSSGKLDGAAAAAAAVARRDGPTERSSSSAVGRNKEAGTTSKERFNYASFDCAATILKSNQGSKGASSILIENKDSYMLNACSTHNKFLIVELCQDIIIDTIVLGNFEFFSSTFRTFRVSISDRYPVKIDKWRELGVFEARNTRGVQAFLVENGLMWARYFRIEFLTHYGEEYYCPVSLLRVHGKTMMDDYLNDVKASRGEDDADDEAASESEVSSDGPVGADLPTAAVNLSSSDSSLAESSSDTHARAIASMSSRRPLISYRSLLLQQVDLFAHTCSASSSWCHQEDSTVINYTTRTPWNPQSSGPSQSSTSLRSDGNSQIKSQTSTKEAKDSRRDIAPVVIAPPHSGGFGRPKRASETPSRAISKAEGASSDAKQPTGAADSSQSAHAQPTRSRQATKHSTEPRQPSKPVADHTVQQGSPSRSWSQQQPPPAAPSTQDSFFKSVHKRLQFLETNSTLSMQYIEEQSRILREAFAKVEKRQLAKTGTFLENLNVTVLSELREFRTQYDQIWQSTVLELSSQRERSRQEVVAMSARMSALADQVVWQRRLAYLQFVLIVVCLVLLIFSRHPAAAAAAGGGGLEQQHVPLLQSLVSRPSASFARYLHLDSEPGTPPSLSSRPASRYGLFSSRLTTHVRSVSSETNVAGDDDDGDGDDGDESDDGGAVNNDDDDGDDEGEGEGDEVVKDDATSSLPIVMPSLASGVENHYHHHQLPTPTPSPSERASSMDLLAVETESNKTIPPMLQPAITREDADDHHLSPPSDLLDVSVGAGVGLSEVVVTEEIRRPSSTPLVVEKGGAALLPVV